MNFRVKKDNGNKTNITMFIKTINTTISPNHTNLSNHPKAKNKIIKPNIGYMKIFLNKKVICVIPARILWEIENLAIFIESGFFLG